MDHVQHFELPYKSRDRMKKFYFDAFDWQLFDLPGSSYTLANSVATHANGMPQRPGAINGGLLPRSDMVQGPSLLIHVGNVRASADRIRRLGGTILTEPTHMGPVVFVRFRDPEGNVLGIFEDAPEQGGAQAASKPKAGAAKQPAAARPKRKKAAATKPKPSKAASPKRKSAKTSASSRKKR